MPDSDPTAWLLGEAEVEECPGPDPTREAQTTKLLLQVFPFGSPKHKRGYRHHEWQVELRTHTILLKAQFEADTSKYLWSGSWKREIASASGTPIIKDMAYKVLNTHNSAVGWVSWVYQKICALSAGTIKPLIQPDNILNFPLPALKAASDLKQLNASWLAVKPYLVQPLPWQPANNGKGAICFLYRHGCCIGVMGIKQREDNWVWRAKITLDNIVPNAKGLDLRASISNLTCLQEACDRLSEIYASNMLDWLRKNS